MAVNKIDPKVIFASEAPTQDTPAVFTNKTVGWGESRKNGGRPTIKQSNALQQETDLKILWLNENSVTPYDASIDYPVNAVTIKDGVFKIFNGSVWNLFLSKASVGLNNVDNTSDINKPISTATTTALNLKADKATTYTKVEVDDLINSSIPDDIVTSVGGESGVVTIESIGTKLDVRGYLAGRVQYGSISQEQFNDGLESIAEMLAIENPKDGMRVFAKSRNVGTLKGGGGFVFKLGSTKNDGGMFFSTSTGSWQRITLEVWHNVQWWGAVGDGVTDDTAAIFSAINAHRNGATSNNMPLGSFCTLYFPASEGEYVVSDTIYTLPFLRLKGDSTKGGSTAHNHKKYMSKIGAKFPLAINYKWIISTENYVTETGLPLAWDGTCTGEQLDAGVITPCFGSCVEDLWIDNLTPENRIYGGVRFIAAPQSSIERCWIENVDLPVLFTGSWDIRCDVGTVGYKAGVVLWGSSNGVRLNGYLHANTNKAPMPQQMSIFDIPVEKTVGLYAQYVPSISSEMLISERHDHGIRLAAETSMTAQSLYLEANKTAITMSSSDLSVGNITGVANDYTLKLGGGSTFEVASCQNNNYTISFFESIDNYAISANIPETIVKADTANTKVFLKNRELKDVVYLSGSTGSDSNSGLISNNPVASMVKALDILNARRTSNQWGDVVADQKKICTMIILDGGEYSPNNYRELKNMDLTIKSSSGSTPRLKTSNQAFKLFDSNIKLKGINVQRTNDSNYQFSQGMFICSGECNIKVECQNVDLAYPLVSVDPSDFANVTLSIIGGTGAMTTDARYFQTTSKNTSINAFVRLDNTGFNLNTSSNNGIDAPAQAYIVKSINSVLV